ncbi:type II toxin-antitoxin system death-on-curing family toxin [Streptomyces sp. NPDC058221]|uniref:type II toxin-antitoxin system death-on-curing family toxin n=1 Tax=Streptomyces sp. NPDC058221 TaxID=3346388 RepID=UPI0036F0FD54
MKYLTVQEVLDLAELACEGQQVAVRDLGLLSSAVHRPQSAMFGVEAYTDLFQKAAALLQSLAVNHPLVDGNKRMAWMSTVVFLDFNGTEMLDIDQDEAYKLVIEVAMGSLEDVERIADRLRALRDAM